MKKVLTFTMLVGVAIIVVSCKKGNNDDPSKNGPTLDLMRDSVYLYAKEAYYWYDAIPSYSDFKPRTYTGTNDLEALEKEVNAISQFKINPATDKPYEYSASSPGEAKYSFIDAGQTSAELGGAQSNFGFAPLYNDINDLRVKYVYAGSAAGLAGVKRGQKILSINGRTNLSYDASSGGANVQFVVNAYAYSNTITMVLQKDDLTTFTVNLTAASYITNPVITYKVLSTVNGGKVGYFVFNTFTSPENATPKLDEVFSYFAANHVNSLVVDLRYNGGGYVSTAEYLSNLIVPASRNYDVMYGTYFNDILKNGRASVLKNQVRRDPSNNTIYNYAQFDYTVAGNIVKFSKRGPLSAIDKVLFIVGGGTASASELVINNLIPQLEVKLIGTTTYGKPVGFFDIKIGKYEMYIPEFETKNSQGKGGYYTGMKPGTADYPGKEDFDDVTHDFGDPNETLLKYALNYVNTRTFDDTKLQVQGVSQPRKTFSIEQAAIAGKTLDAGQFSGMIYDKPLKLK
nr:S41 family peptidase [uncultured Mucilaginibacter sp.]